MAAVSILFKHSRSFQPFIPPMVHNWAFPSDIRTSDRFDTVIARHVTCDMYMCGSYCEWHFMWCGRNDVIAHNPLNCCTWSVHMSTCQMYSNVAYELHYIVIRGMSSYVRAAGPYSWNDHAMQPSFLVHWHTGQDSGILRTQCLPSGRWTNVCCQKYVKNSKDISLVSPRCFANMSALHRDNSNHVPQPRAEISASARSQVGLSQRVSTGQRDLTYFKMASMNWSLALCKGTTVAFKN